MSIEHVKNMKAIQIHKRGGPEVLIYEDAPRPLLGSDEVLIRIHAAGVNPADWRGRSGFIDIPEALRPKLTLPLIPGSDVSGIVEVVGTEATSFKVGDAVYGMIRFPPFTAKGGGRAYAEYTTAPTTDIALKPATFDHIQAAAVPMAALTAWQLLYLDLEPNQTVLINGAAGGVGHFAVQMAKLKGARVIGVASGRHADFLYDLGIDEFIDYTASPVEETVHNVDVVFDCVGGEEGDRLIDVLKPGGRLIPINIGHYSSEHAASKSVILGTKHHQPLRSNGAQLSEIGHLIDSNSIRVAIDSVFPLADASKAHVRGEAGHIQGKIVLQVTPMTPKMNPRRFFSLVTPMTLCSFWI